jgi:hypothetical protein
MSGQPDQPIAAPETPQCQEWRFAWFVVHLATAYLLVKFCTPWLSGWTYGKLLPFLQIPSTASVWEFLFSRVLAFSFAPAFLAGLINGRFKHQSALLVWIVPTTILVYKLITFSSPHSVLYSAPESSALHYYFGGEFIIPAFHNWRDFWDAAGSNPDMARGMAQLTFTAPVYAGFAYSLAAWISMRWDLTGKVTKKVERWEESRFGTCADTPGERLTASSSPEINGTSGSSET